MNSGVLEGAGEETARRKREEKGIRSQLGITEIPVVENNHPIKQLKATTGLFLTYHI